MSIQKDFINVCFYQLCKRGVLILLWLPQHCISVVFRVCFFFYHRVKMAYQRCLQLFLWAFNGFIYLLYLSLGNVPSRWQRIYLPMLEMQEMRVQSLGLEEPLELAMAAHSSILAWTIPWTEEPGGLQSTGSHRVTERLIFSLGDAKLTSVLPII